MESINSNTVLKYILVFHFFVTLDFYFTTFQKERLYFLLLHIYLTAVEVTLQIKIWHNLTDWRLPTFLTCDHSKQHVLKLNDRNGRVSSVPKWKALASTSPAMGAPALYII